MSADIRVIEPGKAIVVDEGRVIRVTHSGGKVIVNGKAAEIEMSDPRDRRRGAGGAGGSGRQEVRSAMPGKVVRVLVAVGATVEPGQGLLILEAMKMQTTVYAPVSGVVKQKLVAPGAQVESKDLLLTIQ